MGVTSAVRELSANWPDALFSIDAQGIFDGQAILGRPLAVEYEAALPGYLTYLQVSSHGDIRLVRAGAVQAMASGSVQVLTGQSLGTERLWLLFSNVPLDSLFAGAESSRALGADRESAVAFVNQVRRLQSGNVKVASRRYEYEVVTAPGETEYTTRGITFRVLGGATHTAADAKHPKCSNTSTVSRGPGGAAIPAHIEFEFDSDRLTRQGKLDLDEFGEVLISTLRDRDVELQGNTDAVGTDDYNNALSARRALAVKYYLEESFAVASSRLKTIGLGKSNPIEPNDTDAGRACNRRVEFVISTRAATETDR